MEKWERNNEWEQAVLMKCMSGLFIVMTVFAVASFIWGFTGWRNYNTAREEMRQMVIQQEAVEEYFLLNYEKRGDK